MEAILCVQRIGHAWATRPAELGDEATAHGRWQEWQASGLWEQIVALAGTARSLNGAEEPGADALFLTHI